MGWKGVYIYELGASVGQCGAKPYLTEDSTATMRQDL